MKKSDIKKVINIKPGKKVGLALGGGGAKGLAHIGVIKVLEEYGIPIDYIVGTSMGALVGGWYAATGNLSLLEDAFLDMSNKGDFDIDKILKNKNKNLFTDKTLISGLKHGLGNKQMSSCHIPFKAIATDVEDGDQIVIDDGKVVDAISASTALPIIFNPVKKDKRLLMDGGFVNPVPADVVKDMGADVVIAVDVSSQWIKISDDFVTKSNMYSIISDALSTIEYQIARHVLEKADIVLRPPVLSFGWLAFDRAEEIVGEGRRETILRIDEIQKKTGYYKDVNKNFMERFWGMVLK